MLQEDISNEEEERTKETSHEEAAPEETQRYMYVCASGILSFVLILHYCSEKNEDGLAEEVAIGSAEERDESDKVDSS